MTGTYRIVVGVDGSEGGRRAVRWAINEAAARSGTVQAIMVWNWDGVDAPTHGFTRPEEERRQAEEILQQELDLAPHPLGVVIAGEVVEGSAPLVLTTAARDADLLVLGSHGHGRLHHSVLGSVAETCVRKATCPVVVLPAPRQVPQTHAEAAIPA